MKKLTFLLCAVTCMHLQLRAQTPALSAKSNLSIGDVVNKLKTLSATQVVEKAYLHFDKPYYNPGDTIYFKAYITAGEKHELSKISGVLHVDLISKNDSLMQSVTLKLSNGISWGDFALPVYTPKGNFRVRAYTQWMQNTGDKYFFDKIIPVAGKSISKVNTLAKTNDKQADVQFFPEGGTFVNAIPSRIAFKAVGPDGLGLNIKGIVVDNLNNEVAKINTAHLGMGQFFVRPEAGKTYTAKITYPDGTNGTIALPKADEKGMTLNINNEAADKVAIEVNVNKRYYAENKDKELNFVVTFGDQVKTVKTVLDNPSIGFDLPKKDMKTGVIQVTVFNENGAPLNERLAFIQNNDDILNLSLTSDKAVYTTQSDVKLSLNATVGAKTPAYGTFSVSVTDESKIKPDENTERSILTELQLSSDVKGYIEQPGYYFSNVTADTKTNLDILMLTQGYRRFVWNELLNSDKPNVAFRPENGFQISGRMSTKEGQPLPNEKVTLFLSQSGQTLTTVTDNTGKFIFNDMGYADKTTFLLKVENSSIKNKAVITLDKIASGVPIAANTQPLSKFVANVPANNNSLDESTPFNQAKENVLKQVKNKVTYHSSNLAGAGNADQVIFRKDFKNAVTLSLGLSGRLRGVQFDKGMAYMTINSVATPGGGAVEPMLLVVDGVIGIKDIDVYNPNDVESVELLKGANATIYGLSGGAGVLVVNTRQGGTPDDDGRQAHAVVMSPGLLSITRPGFYTAKQFYAPRYNVNTTSTSGGTIFWAPNIITDKDGNATFNFTNGNTPGTYRVIMEGIDVNGNVGRQVIKYKVQ